MTKIIFQIVMVLFLASPVFAQQNDAGISVPAPKTPNKVFYNFDEVDILGNIKKPVGSSVSQTPEIRFKKLLNLDESFIPKIVDAIDEY